MTINKMPISDTSKGDDIWLDDSAPEYFGLLNSRDSVLQIEMIKQYEDFRYSHLSKKEREADMMNI
jgi:hypothetical protein